MEIRKKRKRVAIETGVRSNTITASHKPTIDRIDSRYDFLESPTGVGSIKHRFTIKSLGIGQGQSYFKLIGPCDFQDSKIENGWMVYVWKNQTSLESLVWFNGYTGVHAGGTYGHQVAAIGPNYLQEGGTYDLVVVKNGAVNRFYIGKVKQNTHTPVNNPTKEPTGKFPITLSGACSLDNQASKADIIHHEVQFYNTEIDRKGGVEYLNWIEALEAVGNWIPEELYPYVVGHWTCQEKYGNKLHDCVANYNSWKSALFPILKLAYWNSFNRNGSELSYTETSDYLEMKAVAIPSGNYPASYFTHVWWKGGKNYKIVIDVEIFASNVNDAWITFLMNSSSYSWTKTSFGRETLVLDFNPTTDGDNDFYMESRFNVNGAFVRIYSAIMYDVAIGPPLANNHINLNGYDDPELGIPDNTTQTTRFDFYTKQLADLWNLDGTEKRSGLPEITKALQLTHRNYGEVIIPAAAITPIGTDNWTMYFTFYCSADVKTANGSEWIAEFQIGNGIWIVIYTGRVVLALPGIIGGVVAGINSSEDFWWKKGFTTLCLQKVGLRHLLVYERSALRELQLSDQATGTALGGTNVKYKDSLPDIDLSYNTGINFYNKTAGREIHLISGGIKKGNYNKRQFLNLYNNSLFNNPIDINDWQTFAHAGNWDAVNSRFPDFSGNGFHWTKTGYGGNYLTPGDPEYVIKDLNTFR